MTEIEKIIKEVEEHYALRDEVDIVFILNRLNRINTLPFKTKKDELLIEYAVNILAMKKKEQKLIRQIGELQ